MLALGACGASPDPAGAEPASPALGGQVAQSEAPLSGGATCTAFVDAHIAWMENHPGCTTSALVYFQLASHKANGPGVVTLASGYLDRTSPGLAFLDPLTPHAQAAPSTLYTSDDQTQTFSTRTTEAQIYGQTAFTTFAFDPQAAERVKLMLRDDGVGLLSRVTAGGEVSISRTQCQNGLMSGFGDDGALYSVYLTDVCTPG